MGDWQDDVLADLSRAAEAQSTPSGRGGRHAATPAASSPDDRRSESASPVSRPAPSPPLLLPGSAPGGPAPGGPVAGGSAAGGSAPGGRKPDAAARGLSGATAGGSPLRTGTDATPWSRRLGRWATLAAGVSTSRDVREYLELNGRLIAAVPSGRRIVVLADEPAQGSTTVAALLGLTLAGRRTDPVLMVDAAAGGWRPPLHQMLEATPRRTVRELAAEAPRITARPEVSGHLTEVRDRVWLIPADQVARTTGGTAPDAAIYAAAVAPFARFFDITVTDLGAAPGPGTAELLLDRAHALCLVTADTDTGYAGVAAGLQALRDQGGAPWAGRTVVVTNHPSTDGPSRRWRPSRRRHEVDVPVVSLHHDAALRPGFGGWLPRLRPDTHLAAMRLAADLLGTAIPGADGAGGDIATALRESQKSR